GTYKIEQLPNADYEVTADGTALAYSVEMQTVTVLPAQNTPNVDFALTSADGTLEVTVTDSEAVPSPVPNATVQVKDATSGASVTSGITDGSGQVSFSLQPGDYDVSAGAAGYETSPDQNVTITPLTTTAITIALVEVPPGSISGLISRQTDGSLVDGALVEVFSGGLKIAETTSQATPIPGIPETANYLIDPVKAGDHTVIATKSGLTMIPTSRTVTVVTAQRTGNVNFQVKPLYTFPAGLSMTSVPYDLSGTPLATVLGIPPSEVMLAAYNPTTAAYILYPSPPADAFHLGTGYWIYLDALTDLTTSGPVATDPYRRPLLAGWNLIGDPFRGTVDYSMVMVEDRTGALMSLSDAFGAGILQSGLFTWMFGGYRTSLILTPFTGYWVLAFEQCTLVVPRPVGTLAAPSSAGLASRAAAGQANVEPFRRPRDGWSVRIAVTAGSAEDSDNYLGVGIDATDGYDRHYDVQEPPAPVSGTGVTAAFTGVGDTALAADIRSSAGEAKDWSFVVHADEPDQEVRLTWPDLAAMPRTYACTLVDVDGESRVSMRTQRGYTFSSGAGGAARRFLIEVRQGGAGGLAVTGFVVADGRGAKTLAYTLTREARVSVQVLNVAGRVVRGLAQAQQRSAGQNELMWDLRSDNGTRVPDGFYVVRLVAKSADGGAFEATRMATVSR
ncbi:MAG: carboxypeptidase regulatory-like domain-containing protein, partial [Armatimonadota bacterium]